MVSRTTARLSLSLLGAFTLAVTAGLAPRQDAAAQTDAERSRAAAARSAPRPAAAGTSYSIDATHSMALFRVQHLGAGAFWGRFNTLSGTIVHDAEAPDRLSIDVAIDIGSVDTGNESLDGHLKSPDFFAAEDHPQATFKSTSVKRIDESNYEVQGDLTMRGVTRPISANVEWVGTRTTQRGHRCGFEAVFTVDRTDFGIDYGAEGEVLGIETRIIVAMEGVAAPPAEAEAPQPAEQSRMIARFDENEDGVLQREELPDGLQRMFTQLDTNADGALDAEEMEALRAARGRGRGTGGGGSGGGDD